MGAMPPLSVARLLLAAAFLLAALPACSQDEIFVLFAAPQELRERVEKTRTEFQLYGWRFDDDKGHLLSPKTKKPAPRAEVEEFLAEIEASQRHLTLQRMHYLLSRQDLDRPLSPAVQAELKRLVEKRREILPKSVLDALNAPRALGAAVLKAYEDSTHFFDGKVTLGERLGAALPVLGTWNAGQRLPGYFDDAERRLGENLAAAVAKRLRANPVGRGLLEKFRKNGKLELPQFLVLAIDANAHAAYTPSSDSIILNFSAVVGAVVARAPPERRAALEAQLKDAAALAEHLRNNPKALEEFVAGEDSTIYHELVHAWQQRRDPSGVEQLRGNAPDFNMLEGEQEAFVEELRYLHAKILAGDETALREAWDDGRYREFIADPVAFRQSIADIYLQNWPEQAALLPTGLDLQNDRVSLARRLLGTSVGARVEHALKLIGLSRGTRAMQADLDAYTARFAALDKEHPRLQQEGYAALAAWRAKLGRFDEAFTLAAAAEDAAQAHAKALGEAAVQKARQAAATAEKAMLDWLRSATAQVPEETRAEAVNAAARRRAERGRALDADFAALGAGLNLGFAQRYLDAYDKLPDKEGVVARMLLRRAQSSAEALALYRPALKDPALERRAAAVEKRLAQARR